MASYYVWSGATGSANGTSWANAYTTYATAISGKVAGDVFYIAHDHVEAAAATLGSPGTIGNPAKVICVNRGGSVPPVSADRRATAQISGVGGLTFSAVTHWDGVIFTSNSGGGTGIQLCGANQSWTRFDNCSLRLAGVSNYIAVGTSSVQAAYAELYNTTMSFFIVGQQVSLAGTIKWRNTPSALLGAVPTILFSGAGTNGGVIECIGVDLSAAGSGKTLINSLGSATATQFRFVDCKLDAAVTKAAVQSAHGAADINFVRCGAAGGSYAVHRQTVAGTLIEETVIVRTGGASA